MLAKKQGLLIQRDAHAKEKDRSEVTNKCFDTCSQDAQNEILEKGISLQKTNIYADGMMHAEITYAQDTLE